MRTLIVVAGLFALAYYLGCFENHPVAVLQSIPNTLSNTLGGK
jgi:hypothetical protein